MKPMLPPSTIATPYTIEFHLKAGGWTSRSLTPFVVFVFFLSLKYIHTQTHSLERRYNHDDYDFQQVHFEFMSIRKALDLFIGGWKMLLGWENDQIGH